jgi:hypothetical protein
MTGKKTGWCQSLLFGLFMTPLAMLCFYLVFGLLPDELQHSMKLLLSEHLFLSSIVFYAAGVWAFRSLNLDLRKKEDWPDN